MKCRGADVGEGKALRGAGLKGLRRGASPLLALSLQSVRCRFRDDNGTGWWISRWPSQWKDLLKPDGNGGERERQGQGQGQGKGKRNGSGNGRGRGRGRRHRKSGTGRGQRWIDMFVPVLYGVCRSSQVVRRYPHKECEDEDGEHGG